MKFFWQQIIACLILILASLMVISTRMEKILTQQITQDLQSQLLNYGTNITTNKFSRNDLVKTTQLLASENILIQVYLNDGRTIYPSYDQKFDADLNEQDLAQLRDGKTIDFRKVQRLGTDGQVKPYLIVYLPHQDVAQFPKGFISLAAPLDDLQSQINAIRRNIFISFLISIAIGIFLSFLSALYQMRKIKKLQAVTQEIISGNYDLNIDIKGKDEFGDLARDFQKMSDSLFASEKEVRRQNELRGRFIADLAHEMKTPLHVMNGTVEGMLTRVLPEKTWPKSLSLLNKQIHRLTRLIQVSLNHETLLAGKVTPKISQFDGAELFNELQLFMAQATQKKGNEIVVEVEPGLTFKTDRDHLTQIIMNLLSNANQFSENSLILLEGYNDHEWSRIKVVDHGIGIAEKDQKLIWERFYKVDESRRDNKFGESGIGLALVKTLVESMGGTITLQSTLGQGASFTVSLPRTPQGQGPTDD